MIADDVDNMQADLNSFSAFPYKNELGKIKNILFSPYRTVAQYCRRIHTQRKVLNLVRSLPQETIIIKQTLTKGVEQINHKQNYFSVKHPDNTALLNNGSVIEIHEILLTNEKYYLQVTSFNIKKSIYFAPCDSAYY